MVVIHIKNLLLRTQVGFNEHEIGKKQDLILNLRVYYRLDGEEQSDDSTQALDYRAICKSVIHLVEGNAYNLLEKVAHDVIDLIFKMERVEKVSIEIDKPHALRFAESVSFSCSKSLSGGYE